MKDFLKSFAFKVLGVIALILVGVMIYGASTGGLATIPATIAGAIITPLQSAVTSVSDGISGFFGQFGSSKETREELEQAQKELPGAARAGGGLRQNEGRKRVVRQDSRPA